MKRRLPPRVKGAFAVSFGLSVLLFAVQCALAMLMAGEIGFSAKGWIPFSLTRALGLGLALGVNGYALSRAVKARHFLGLFSEWPGLPEIGSNLNETRLLAVSAQQAFFEGDHARVLTLIERLGPGSPQTSLVKGRSLTWVGRFEEAVTALELGGQGPSARRYLLQRRALFFWSRRYFSQGDIDWALAQRRLLGLGLVALGLSLGVVAFHVHDMRRVMAPQFADFSEVDFKVTTQGPFTLHYHDEAFMRLTADAAEDALAASLAFLELDPATFAPGQIHVFLCADQAEYLARAPFARSWEAASALPSKDQVYLYRMPDNRRIYYEVVLAHELTHLCYHKVVPAGREDSWLNEGLADYLGYKFGLERAHYPRQAWLMEKNFKNLKTNFLPFEAFLTENPRAMQDTAQVNEFYTQGFSIVYVLVEDYGKESFLNFLRSFGKGRPLAEALADSYPTIRTASELHAVWDLYMR